MSRRPLHLVANSGCRCLRRDGGGRLHYPLPTNYSADQRIHRRRSTSRRIVYEKQNQEGAEPGPYVLLRKTRVYIDTFAHTRETRRHAVLLHSQPPSRCSRRRLQESSDKFVPTQFRVLFANA